MVALFPVIHGLMIHALGDPVYSLSLNPSHKGK